MELPQRLQVEFTQELDEYGEEQQMPYVTSFEREAMFDLIEDALRTKFGEEAMELADAIHSLNDAEKYRVLHRTVVTATTLEEVRRTYAKVTAPPSRKKKSGKRG